MGGRVQQLWEHPNYAQPYPMETEDLVTYTLRCAAHLISPPQIEGESEETECVDLAREVLRLAPLVWQRWRDFWGEDA